MFHRKTSVDAIMSTFTRTIDDLSTHADKMEFKATKHKANIAHEYDCCGECETEAKRARNIADKLIGIMN